MAIDMQLERDIIRLLIERILAQGSLISVHDWFEGDMIATRSTDTESILEDVFCIETPLLRIYNTKNEKIGSIMLVPGNGEDIIADYSESMENVCKEVWGEFEVEV